MKDRLRPIFGGASCSTCHPHMILIWVWVFHPLLFFRLVRLDDLTTPLTTMPVTTPRLPKYYEMWAGGPLAKYRVY